MPDTITEREFVKAVTLVNPSARIVVIVVKIHSNQKHEVVVLPVLAIETAVVWHWIRREPGDDNYGVPLNSQELRSAGYQFAGEQLRRELIVLDNRQGEGLVSVNELFRQRNLGVRAVVCEWPQSEDETRLAPIIDELVDQQKREVSRA